VDKPVTGFVPLKSLKQGAPDPEAALAEIRRLYFTTTRKTIDNDLAHAIELLKNLPTEEARERATVFMHGLSDMQREWQGGKKRGTKVEKWKSGRSGKVSRK
jgi:hypothetical protein